MTEPAYSPRVERRTRQLEVRGIDYAIHEWGNPDARLLLCLHGWGDSGATFQFLADELIDGAPEDWFVVAPDWRGFGDSGHNRVGYWYPDYIADLHELLGHYAPGQPADLLGHSMGGNVAALYAGTFPGRVRAFVNAEGFGLRDSDPADAPARYRRWIERANAGETFSDYPDFDSLAAKIRKQSPGMSAAAARFVAETWAVERDGRVHLKADPRHRLPNPVLYRRAEAEACWRAVTAPVLMIIGENSNFREQGHPHDGAFDFDLPFPDSRSVMLPDSGHMLHFEVPAALAIATRDFLAPTV